MNKNRRIVIGGMPQSGTTALFNIARFILQTSGYNVAATLWHSRKNRLPNGDIAITDKTWKNNVDAMKEHLDEASRNLVLVKEHHHDDYLQTWADAIIVGKRDIRDSIASRRRRGKHFNPKGRWTETVDSMGELERWCDYLTKDCFMDWKNKSYIFCYEEYKKSPKRTVQEISAILTSSTLSRQHVDKILDAVNNLHRFDARGTFFSENKITAGGKVNNFSKDLTSEEIAFIEENYPEWIVNYEDH